MLNEALRIKELRRAVVNLQAELVEAEQTFVDKHGQELPRKFTVIARDGEVIIEKDTDG